MANLEAAMRANHKRTPPKTFEQSLQKKEEKLKELENSQTKDGEAEGKTEGENREDEEAD